MTTLTCNECGWSGAPEELVSLTDDPEDRNFSFCPFCESDDFEEDEEEEEDDGGL